MGLIVTLYDMGLCPEDIEWMKDNDIYSIKKLWKKCPLGDLMFMLLCKQLHKPGWPTPEQLTATYIKCLISGLRHMDVKDLSPESIEKINISKWLAKGPALRAIDYIHTPKYQFKGLVCLANTAKIQASPYKAEKVYQAELELQANIIRANIPCPPELPSRQESPVSPELTEMVAIKRVLWRSKIVSHSS